jgi:hypothetical protein
MPAPWFGTAVADRINMIQPGHSLTGTGPIQDFFGKADNVNQWTIYNLNFDGGSNTLTASLGAMVTAPDGTNTAQKIVEATNNGLHQMQAGAFLHGSGGSGGAYSGMRLKLGVIAKAAERTRIALQIVNDVNNDAGVTTVFDLQGGQIGVPGTTFGTVGQQDPFGIGFRWVSKGDTITALGGGWYLCTMDVQAGYVNFNFIVTLSLDAGSGTAAINTSYAGDGSSGVNTWRSSLLPTRAFTLSKQTFFDDFNSLSTIDVSDTRTQGFNWYTHNTFPWFSGFTATPPANYSVGSSILTAAGVANILPNAEVLNTCAVPTGGTTKVGITPSIIGKAFVPPWLIEARLHWDDATSTPRTFTTSFWTFALDIVMSDPAVIGNPPSLPHIELDFYEDNLNFNADIPVTSYFTVSTIVDGGTEASSLRVTLPVNAFPIWKPVINYSSSFPAKVAYNGVFYRCINPNGPDSGGPAQPDISPADWTVISPSPAASAGLAVDFSNFHTLSNLMLPYVSQTDPGVLMGFFEGYASYGTCYGPDVLGPISPLSGGMPTFNICDTQGFPLFIQTGQNYSVFYDWVSAYQLPAANLSALTVLDGNGAARQTQALDLSNAGTGPFTAGRAPLDGVAGSLRAITTLTNATAIDNSAIQAPVKEFTASTTSQTSVASSASNVPLLAPNPARGGASIYNDSTQILYILLVNPYNNIASSTLYTAQVAAGARYELPIWYTGGVNGIWASANGFARITEITP